MRNLTLFLLLFVFSCNSKSISNAEKLTNELDSIRVTDQKYRTQIQELQKAEKWNTPEMGELLKKQEALDQVNLARIITLIDSLKDYPGINLVGNSASKTAFYVLQHAPDSVQEKYYELLVEASRNGELEKRLGAIYQDRYLMHRNEKQIFGTQIRTEYQTDSISGERIANTFVWPITDTINIDALRIANGLDSLEPYLNKFGLSRWE